MKTVKRALAVLLAAVLLCVGVPLAAAEDEPTYQVGDHIQFGTYPQTRVDETVALASAAENAVWRSYDYYTGTGDWYDGNMTPRDYMQFADFLYNGAKYRAVMFTQYRPYETGNQSNASTSIQDDNGYAPNIVYYFIYEPLTWRVLDPSDGYIMCESIVDSQAYQNTIYVNKDDKEFYQAIGSSVYANDYATSSIRTWLNYDFYETAFADGQKENIKTTELNNDAYPPDYPKYNSTATNDKIFLLSCADASNISYGFSSGEILYDTARRGKGTDYAKCQGLWIPDFDDYSRDNTFWWLRSPGPAPCGSDDAWYSHPLGYLGSDGDFITGVGVRPACKITNLTSDISQSEYLFSAGMLGHQAGEPVRENEQPATCKTAASYESVTYCTLCGEELSRETVYEGEPDPEAHDMQIQSYVAPTCEEGGYAPFVCSRCGYTIETDPEPALGHDYNIVYTWAKDDSTVTAEKVCSRCGDIALKEVADVTTEVTVKPTCSTEGELTLTAAFKNKAFYAQTKTKALPTDPDAHVFRVTVTPPTCVDDGYTTHACTLCRYGYSDNIVPALGHDYQKHAPKAPTCKETGWEAYETCSRCDYTTYQELATVDHADADNDGYCDGCGAQMTGGDHCKVCGKIHNGNFFDKLTGFFHRIIGIFKR